MKNQDTIIIGGGIHGITAALALAETNANVTVIDKRHKLLQGTSGATHNRAHMGYHYPRSIKTAEECLQGLNYFQEKYPKALYYPKKAYYLIAKKDSKTTTEDYIRFCDSLKLDYKLVWPSNKLVSKEHLDSSFCVPEPCFNLRILNQLLERKISQKKVTVVNNATVVDLVPKKDGLYKVAIISENIRKDLKANIVINATYAYSNSILHLCNLDCDGSEYCYHTTEVVVVKNNCLSIPALTVMDGPFITILPYAGYKGLSLVYDVAHSVVHRQEGFLYKEPQKTVSNWNKISEHGQKYFPFFKKLEYIKSLWGSRPVPVRDTDNSRHTTIICHKTFPGIYTIREGKFISAPLIAQKLVEIIRRHGLIK